MEQSAHIRCAPEPQRVQGTNKNTPKRAGQLALANIVVLQLTPFVSREVRSEPGDYKGLNKGPQDPYFYVEQWKRYNGVD